jgi:integrase
VGDYSEMMCKKGNFVHIVDISEKLLETTKKRLIDAGFESQLLGATLGLFNFHFFKFKKNHLKE